MTNLVTVSEKSAALKVQLIREISGFVELFGVPVDKENNQVRSAVESNLDIDKAKHFHLSEEEKGIECFGMRRLVACDGKLVGFSHTWSVTKEIGLDTLVAIHEAFEIRLNKVLGR
jgi:hypothetical protein